MKQPEAPDPKETAAAQTGMNRDTATTQQLLNMTNQITPDGSLNYSQTGNNSFVGADGKTVSLPQFTATQTLSPQQQAIKNQTDSASLNIAGLANDQSGFLKDYLGKPLDLNNEEVESRLYDLGSKRLDPRFAQEDDSLRTRLANSGIKEGSAAYDAAFANQSQSKNDAYNQLLLTGRQQSVQEIMAERSNPINEITALLSGSQVTQPNFTSTPQTNVAGVDYAGLVGDKYKADSANSQAAMGGLFGLAAAPFSMFKFSDKRLKSNIKRVGVLDNGLPVYSYIIAGRTEIGLMADEVEQAKPEAVAIHSSGFKMVDYALATEAA